MIRYTADGKVDRQYLIGHKPLMVEIADAIDAAHEAERKARADALTEAAEVCRRLVRRDDLGQAYRNEGYMQCARAIEALRDREKL